MYKRTARNKVAPAKSDHKPALSSTHGEINLWTSSSSSARSVMYEVISAMAYTTLSTMAADKSGDCFTSGQYR